jgi:hypothetical protein
MYKRLFGVWALFALAGLFSFYGCGGGDNGGGPAPVPADLDSAYQELTSLMGEMIDTISSGNEMHPEDYDFSGLHGVFRNYEQTHPSDPKSSFGAALTSLLTLSTSDDLNALLDTITAMGNGGFPKWRVIPNPTKMSSRREFFTFPTELPATGIDKNFIAQSYVALMVRAISNPPKFSEIQQMIRDDFIPAIDNASRYMDKVLDDPNFVFWVTPEMMGETSDSIEIDRADFLVFAAGLRVIQSFFHLAVAYNVDIPSYDLTGIEYIFDQSNQWMSLHPDGRTQMTSARTSFLDAIGFAHDAISALQNEPFTDPDQSNDLIVVDWSPTEYEEAYMVLDTVEAYLTTTQTIYADFDGDGGTEMLNVDMSSLFDNPIDGIFSLLPPYTSAIGAVEDTVWYYWWYWDGYEYREDSVISYIDEYYAVIITWDADTFNEWIFPNPSINGLFPDVSSDIEFKSLFGMTPDMWQKQMRLDLNFSL